jgi:hypothetical protein
VHEVYVFDLYLKGKTQVWAINYYLLSFLVVSIYSLITDTW